MGVRPPDDDVDDGPDVVEFGIAALDAELQRRDLQYPVEADSLRENHGTVTVPVDAAGTEIQLAEALEEAPVQRFESERELLDVLHPVFEQYRQERSRSFLRQLRALLPF
jgi:hypothetical protein